MTYLVDSDWIVDALVGIPSAVAPLEASSPDELSVSIITLGEIYDGAFGFPDPEAHLTTFRQFLAGFVILGLSDPIMERFARNRALLRRQGNLIPDLDLLIAATALHHGLTLMTRNLRLFRRVPDLQVYRAADASRQKVSQLVAG